ncbi:SMP-30/gluconolactonase/LRE family protein [Nonomuraea sp. NPDC050394]|uniref:SMP-30/gluconolactonase/LRE family protein n=1 Tax=Nonomuraea sp. NPDC050394 TaxID=3364363 RepID=UPI0037A2E3E3
MRRLRAEVVAPGTAELGECPIWDQDRGLLLWADLPTGLIHTYNPSACTCLESAPTEHFAAGVLEGAAAPGAGFRGGDARGRGADPRAGMVTAMATRRGGGLVVARGDRLTLEPGGVPLGRWDLPRDTRFNDGAVDPWGHFWIGTMCTDRPGTAALYRVAPDGRTTTELTGVTCSNGLGWAPDHRTMYYVDTPTRTLDAFDVHDGRITGRRVVAQVRGGLPDGLAVDEDGCVWVAVWDGAAVHRYTPEGRLDTVVETPCARPTSCAFGGGTLYVTTAAPDGGSLLAVTGVGGGVPPTPFPGVSP